MENNKQIVPIIVILALILFIIGGLYFSNSFTGKAISNPPVHQHHMMILSEEQFIFEMVPHHQEAVDSSKAILVKTNNAELRSLAQNIIDAQTLEIRMMENWKSDWYSNSKYESTYVNMMPNLSYLNDKEADVAYLNGMIMHHQMAIMMAQQVLILNPKQEVKDFAQDIIEVQSSEINQMYEMLEDYQ